MQCPTCGTAMVKARATNFGEEYDYCRVCKKEITEMAPKVGVDMHGTDSSRLSTCYVRGAEPHTWRNSPAGSLIRGDERCDCGAETFGKVLRASLTKFNPCSHCGRDSAACLCTHPSTPPGGSAPIGISTVVAPPPPQVPPALFWGFKRITSDPCAIEGRYEMHKFKGIVPIDRQFCNCGQYDWKAISRKARTPRLYP